MQAARAELTLDECRCRISHGETRRQTVPSRARPRHNSGRTGLANEEVRISRVFWPRDIVARLVADGLQQKYPTSAFIVENKPGAGDNLGTDLVAKATPDGSTIGVSIGGPLAINTLLYAQLPCDPRKDIATVTQLVTQPSVLAVNPALGVVQSRTSSPAPVKIRGSTILLRSETARYRTSQWKQSPSKRAPNWCTSLSQFATGHHGGDPKRCADRLPSGDSGHAAGRNGSGEDFAVSTEKRSPYLPDLPTLKESGIDVEADAWNGLIAPGATPKPIIDKISKDVAEIIRQPMLREKLATQLMEPLGSSPDELRARINGEIERWAPVIEAANVKLN